MPEIASTVSMEDEWNELSPAQTLLASFATFFYFFFGGEFVGFALWVVGNEVSGALTAILYGVGSLLLFNVYNGRFAFFWGLLLAAALPVLLLLISAGIADLASNGALSGYGSKWSYGFAEDALAAATLWFVFGVPRRGFAMGVDRDGEGHARECVVRVCTVIASVLTGAYVLLLHFGGGPLRSVHVNALAVGTLFAVFLVAPAYRVAASRCWKFGLVRMFLRSSEGRLFRAAAVRELAAGQREYARRRSAERYPELYTKKETEPGHIQSGADPERDAARETRRRSTTSGTKATTSAKGESRAKHPSAMPTGGKGTTAPAGGAKGYASLAPRGDGKAPPAPTKRRKPRGRKSHD